MSGKSTRTYDLIVVGAGINGAGIARDAAGRGLSVLVVEKDDIAAATSQWSTKLIHGGLRYLEQGEIGLVFESVSERRVQTRVAPHLVRPLPFLIPIYKGVRPGLEIMNVGLWIYDSLALFRAPRLHIVNSRTFSSRFFNAAAMKLNASASSRSSSCERTSTRASKLPCAS